MTANWPEAQLTSKSQSRQRRNKLLRARGLDAWFRKQEFSENALQRGVWLPLYLGYSCPTRCGKLSKNTSQHVEKDVSKHTALKVAPRQGNRMPVRTDQNTLIQESKEESVLLLHLGLILKHRFYFMYFTLMEFRLFPQRNS